MEDVDLVKLGWSPIDVDPLNCVQKAWRKHGAYPLYAEIRLDKMGEIKGYIATQREERRIQGALTVSDLDSLEEAVSVLERLLAAISIEAPTRELPATSIAHKATA